MKFRRLIAITLLLCMVFSLASCKSGAKEAKTVVTSFMEALTTYDLDAIAKCVEDIPTSSSDYIHDVYSEDYYKDIYELANEGMSYSIVSANSKEVKVKVSMPDLYTLYQNTLMSVVSQAMTNEEFLKYTLDENNDPSLVVLALMYKDIEENGIDYVDEEITLSVGKINDQYKILTNDQLKLVLTSKLCLAQKEAVDVADEGTTAE